MHTSKWKIRGISWPIKRYNLPKELPGKVVLLKAGVRNIAKNTYS